jgi:hypothetical protein
LFVCHVDLRVKGGQGACSAKNLGNLAGAAGGLPFTFVALDQLYPIMKQCPGIGPRDNHITIFLDGGLRGN